MVVGIESFLDKFGDYPDCYTIIGGAACEILMNDANVELLETYLLLGTVDFCILWIVPYA